MLPCLYHNYNTVRHQHSEGQVTSYLAWWQVSGCSLLRKAGPLCLDDHTAKQCASSVGLCPWACSADWCSGSRPGLWDCVTGTCATDVIQLHPHSPPNPRRNEKPEGEKMKMHFKIILYPLGWLKKYFLFWKWYQRRLHSHSLNGEKINETVHRPPEVLNIWPSNNKW